MTDYTTSTATLPANSSPEELIYWEPRLCGVGLLTDAELALADREPRSEGLDPETIEYCADFLRIFTPQRKFTAGSYEMKHIAENVRRRYVSNGELIAGAVLAGTPYKPTGVNADLPIPKMESRFVRQATGRNPYGTTRKPPGWDEFLEKYGLDLGGA